MLVEYESLPLYNANVLSHTHVSQICGFMRSADTRNSSHDEEIRSFLMELRAQDQLTYHGWKSHWLLTLKATQLVPDQGVSESVPIIGTIPIILVPGKHIGIHSEPINRLHPSTIVTNGFLVIEPEFLVSRDGIKGVSLYADYSGSSTSVSVTSEGDRNPLAPINWKSGGEYNHFTDPSSRLGLEWRTMPNGTVWMNHAIHGWDDFGMSKHDDRFGSPVDVSTMYSPTFGCVKQTIWEPKYKLSLGINNQTLPYSALHSAYTIAVWFPLPDYAGYTFSSKIDHHKVEPQNHAFVCNGEIFRYIKPNPYGPMYWNRSPTLVYRLFPVKREQLTTMLALTLDSRSDLPMRQNA